MHPMLPFVSSGNRGLSDNQLTSLEVGIFGKNTALIVVYVGQAIGYCEKEEGSGACTPVAARGDSTLPT